MCRFTILLYTIIQGNKYQLIIFSYKTYVLRPLRVGTTCDCKTWLWVGVKYLLKFIFPFLRSGVETKRGVLPRNTQCLQNPAERGECLNTKFPLPTLLCAGYNVKLIYFWCIVLNWCTQYRQGEFDCGLFINAMVVCSNLLKEIFIFE